MGENTFVNNHTVINRSVKASPLRSVRQGLDLILVSVVVALTLFGLLMVYSAGLMFADTSDYFLLRQLLWAAIGIVAAGIMTFVPYHIFPRVTVILMVGTLILLVIVFILGTATLGSVRSIFGGSVRPSELAKLVLIIYVSVWLNAKRDVLNDIFLGLIPLGFILGLNTILILIQPDLSAALTVLIIGGLLFFLGGADLRQIVLLLVIAVIVGWIGINVYSTARIRVEDYLAGLQNPLEASYHVRRSLEAIINGGFFGVGIGHSSTKFTGLPVAHTDSIFSIVAEETGLLGVGALILAYVAILWRGMLIAKNAPDQLGRLLAAGITIWITFEAFLNMAVMVNLLPQAGNALPFISYGGSSLLITLISVGILLNIGRTSEQKKQQGENTFASVVDLRWRDGRGRVSRTVRPSGS